MIIDGDVHISPTPEAPVSQQVEEMIRRLDRAGIDKALTWLQPPYMRDIDKSNQYVKESAERFPDRILPFGWADPRLGVEHAIRSVHRCLDDYGFYGVKLNGAQNDFYIDDMETVRPVLDEIVASGKLLALHIGTDAFDKTHPYRLGKVAARYPGTRILAVHMGGVGFHDLSNAAIEAAQEHDNITLIGSAVRAVPILKAVRTLGAERVCFGSDMPFELPHVEIAKYDALLDGEITPAEKALVMGGNLARLFGLET